MALLQIFDTACPALTPVTAPVEAVTVPAGLYVVKKVTIWVPNGHAGLTGIALGYGHQPIIPSNGTYLSANDEVFPFELGNDYPPGVAWSVFVCNLDIQPHSFETRWELTQLQSNESTPVAQPLTAAAILAAGSAAPVGV